MSFMLSTTVLQLTYPQGLDRKGSASKVKACPADGMELLKAIFSPTVTGFLHCRLIVLIQIFKWYVLLLPTMCAPLSLTATASDTFIVPFKDVTRFGGRYERKRGELAFEHSTIIGCSKLPGG